MIFDNRANLAVAPRQFIVSSERPMAMLKLCPAYQPSPLYEIAGLADQLGVAKLHVKDESSRMRLGSFKALGGAFAVGQMVSSAANTQDLESDGAKAAAKNMTFITASAGNHGLSVAAGARVFGARAVIYLASAVPEGFANRIRKMGADVVRVDGSYEDSVAAAIKASDNDNCYHLADGSWEGYIGRPALIMEGYTVVAEECRAAFETTSIWPTHVLLQAGVGGFAAAFAAHIRRYWAVQPEIIIVEPDAAPCLLESVKAGRITRVNGPTSNMGRLDCKDASLIAYSSLKNDADIFVTISDDEARDAVRRFADFGVSTTPSGAATLAAFARLNIDRDAHCLIAVTEGLEEG